VTESLAFVPYRLIPDEDTFCPACDNTVMILAPEKMRFDLPTFYVCYYCAFVTQIGVGVVTLAREDEA
jgi:hypothetical protein